MESQKAISGEGNVGVDVEKTAILLVRKWDLIAPEAKIALGGTATL
jgi:hypothetical protein